MLNDVDLVQVYGTDTEFKGTASRRLVYIKLYTNLDSVGDTHVSSTATTTSRVYIIYNQDVIQLDVTRIPIQYVASSFY